MKENKVSRIINKVKVISWGNSDYSYKLNLSNHYSFRRLSESMRKILGKDEFNKILNCNKYKVTFVERPDGKFFVDELGLVSREFSQYGYLVCFLPSKFYGKRVDRVVKILS